MEMLALNGLVEVVAQWLEMREVYTLQLTSQRLRAGVNWEMVARHATLRRAGTSERWKRAMVAGLGSWTLVERHLQTRTPTHELSCIACGRWPIDGPLHSCFHCFGLEAVWCADCDACASSWHPPDHVVIRWPKARPASRVHDYKGRFRIKSLNWYPVRRFSNTGGTTCAVCGLVTDGLVVRCLTCPDRPDLCPKCAFGSRDAMEGSPHCKTVRLVERHTSWKLYCGERGSPASPHCNHKLLFYPHMSPLDRKEAAHNCQCDKCGTVPPATMTRYRCALCPDYDRCERCLFDHMFDPGSFVPNAYEANAAALESWTDRQQGCSHRDPMMVLQCPEQRDLVRYGTRSNMNFYQLDAAGDSSDSS